MAEEQLQQFLEKVAQLNQLVALIEGNPQLRERLSACSNHLEVVALAAEQGLQIGQRWGEPILQTNAAVNNLWASAAPPPGGERVQLLLEGKGLRLELIHSVAASGVIHLQQSTFKLWNGEFLPTGCRCRGSGPVGA